MLCEYYFTAMMMHMTLRHNYLDIVYTEWKKNPTKILN